MKLSELLYRAACVVRPEPEPERKRFRKSRTVKGWIAIPNKIRKRFTGAAR